MKPDLETSWHLDRRVPLALIITLAIQTMTVVWWASGVNITINQHALRIEQLAARADSAAQAASAQAIQLARIEEGLSGLRQDINRLLNVIERNRQ